MGKTPELEIPTTSSPDFVPGDSLPTHRARDMHGSGATSVELSSQRLGVGVNGAVNLASVIAAEGVKGVAVKTCDENEYNLMGKLTSGQVTKSETHIPTMIGGRELEPVGRVSKGRRHKRGRHKARAEVQPSRYEVLISACEMGSLQQQELQDKVARGELSDAQVQSFHFQVLRDVTTALAHAHALEHEDGRGILHLDVKPANVFIDKDGLAYLGDWGHGLACEDDGTIALSPDRMIGVGTPYYIPPESAITGAADQEITLSGAADMWSLGAMLGEMIGEEVALVCDKELDEKKNVMAKLFAIGQAAEEKMKPENKEQWQAATSDATDQLAALIKDRSAPFDPTQVKQALKALSVWLTAPEALRPTAEEFLKKLNQLNDFMPQVAVIAHATDGGTPRISAFRDVVASSAAMAASSVDPAVAAAASPPLLVEDGASRVGDASVVQPQYDSSGLAAVGGAEFQFGMSRAVVTQSFEPDESRTMQPSRPAGPPRKPRVKYARMFAQAQKGAALLAKPMDRPREESPLSPLDITAKPLHRRSR
ncbi:MAG: hypothetical protein P1U63_00240 [Coxiellaceae bacterium]|nr:hypothetical protein [Coxiellaceae bacterium]